MRAGVAKLSERAFTKMVIDCARLCGFLVAHFRPARTARGWRTPCQGDARGFVDLVLVHPARRVVWFVELKTDAGRLTDDQERWARALGRAGADHMVWRPAQWDQIEGAIRGD